MLYELCTHKYPYFADTIEELQVKVIKEKYNPIPMTVSKSLSEVIQKCLIKKPESRISIDEIICLDSFQSKCKLLKIKLPAELNLERIK
jgi:serine/threonine protein kinase